MNNWNGVGRITRDIELRYLPGGSTAVANFTMAIDKGLSKDKKAEFESQGKATANFINVVAWNKSAEFAANYLAKGLMVGIEGTLENNNYEDKDGKMVYGMDVNCRNIIMIEWKEDGRKSGSNKEVAAEFTESDENIPF